MLLQQQLTCQFFFLLACPLSFYGIPCMKKVVQQSNSNWHCTKCNGKFIECDYRYLLCFQLHKHTSHLDNVITFDDAATKLLGMEKNDLCLLSSEPTSFKEFFSKVSFQHFLFTLSIKIDTFNGFDHLKATLVKLEDLPYTSTSKVILEEIKFNSTPRKHVVHQL